MLRLAAVSARLVIVLALVASTQGLLFVQGAFVLNQDWVVANLCVNRDRPELNCDGHCVLSQRLQEQQERDESRNAANLEVALAVTALVAAPSAVPSDAGRAVEPPRDAYAFARPNAAPADIFHPPRQA
jgi:hypothetical protein